MSRPTISETNLSRLNRFSGKSTDDKIGQALLQLSLAENKLENKTDRLNGLQKKYDALTFNRLELIKALSAGRRICLFLLCICAGLVLYIVM